MLQAIPTNVHAEDVILMAGLDDRACDVKITRRFHIRTYAKLSKRERNSATKKWSNQWSLLECANDFLKTLNKEEQESIITLFIEIGKLLDNIPDMMTMTDTVRIINNQVYNVFDKYDLAERIVVFVTNNIRITSNLPNLSNVGKRPQDHEDKTFVYDEFIQVVAVAIMHKIMFPIFGEIIYVISNMSSASNQGKEMYALAIMDKTLENKFGPIYSKLERYINGTISSSMDNDGFQSLYGVTHISLTRHKMASLLIKNLVNFDLYRPKSGIITYLYSSLKDSIKSETSKSTGANYMARFENDNSSDEESNKSLIEDSIATFVDTVDKKPLILLAIQQLIGDYISTNTLRMDIYDEALAYYGDNTPSPTIISELIVGLFVGNTIGSSYNIKYLTSNLYVKLLAVIQLYMIRKGFAQLAPLLTLEIVDTLKVPNKATTQISLTRDSGITYTSIKDHMLYLENFTKHSEYLNKVIDLIIKYDNRVSLPPMVIGLSKLNISNKTVFEFDSNLIDQLYEFIYLLMVDQTRSI